MSKVTHTDDKIVVECTCGVNHEITKDNNELKLKSIFTKKRGDSQDEKTETGENIDGNERERRDESESIFEWF